VIPKELAFRGVLLGSTLHLWGTWRAVLITSVLFGLWHITTTLHTQSDNQTVRHASAALVVLGDVAVMAAARVIFCWLRLRSSSLVAPVLAHFATRLRGAVVPRRPPRAVIDARLAVNVAPHRTSPVPNQRAEPMKCPRNGPSRDPESAFVDRLTSHVRTLRAMARMKMYGANARHSACAETSAARSACTGSADPSDYRASARRRPEPRTSNGSRVT
jgi:hypothetical protein